MHCIEIYNVPEHCNKEDVSYFLWKNLQKAHGVRKLQNPIVSSQVVCSAENKKFMKIWFKSGEEAANMMDLNGIYLGTKPLYFHSTIVERLKPILNLSAIKIRKIVPFVADGFNKLYVGNLPPMENYEIINFLCELGELKAYAPVSNDKTQCFAEYATDQATQKALQILNATKLKGRSIVAKRSTLMKSSQTKAKTTVVKRLNIFEKDISSYYLTLDVDNFFRNLKTSCILCLKGVMPLGIDPKITIADIGKEVRKVGEVVRMQYKGRNLYIEYQKVELAQIAYLLLMRRKYDGRTLQIVFYDPIKFVDGDLI